LVSKALQIDRANGNDYWEQAIQQEMSKAKVAHIPVKGVTPDDIGTNQVDALQSYQEIK
jgi:hypothetical protein